jgi:hypothetical protein
VQGQVCRRAYRYFCTVPGSVLRLHKRRDKGVLCRRSKSGQSPNAGCMCLLLLNTQAGNFTLAHTIPPDQASSTDRSSPDFSIFTRHSLARHTTCYLSRLPSMSKGSGARTSGCSQHGQCLSLLNSQASIFLGSLQDWYRQRWKERYNVCGSLIAGCSGFSQAFEAFCDRPGCR